MNAKQYRRVKILITELEKLRKTTKKPKFYMGNRMSRILQKRVSKRALRIAIMEATREPCGTEACLAGKAGLIPRIRRMGFKWDVMDEPGEYGYAKANFRYKFYKGDEAVRHFFGRDIFNDIFMNTAGIKTLFQGINKLKAAVKTVRESGAVEESSQMANDFCGRAIDALSALPDNAERETLAELARYILDRQS